MKDKINIEKLRRKISRCHEMIAKAKSIKFDAVTWSDEEIGVLKKLFDNRAEKEAAIHLEKLIGPYSPTPVSSRPNKPVKSKRTRTKASVKKKVLQKNVR